MPFYPEEAKAYQLRRYREHRATLIEMLGGKCKQCGSVDNLEFDHIDPALKDREVGELLGRVAMKTVLLEAMKCQLLCRDCHIRKTRLDRAALPRTFRHGTIYAWMKMKCQCVECVAARRAWHDSRNARRRLADGAAPRGRYRRWLPDESRCGTHTGYSCGCRCAACRAAHATYMRGYNAKKRASTQTMAKRPS